MATWLLVESHYRSNVPTLYSGLVEISAALSNGTYKGSMWWLRSVRLMCASRRSKHDE
ncbi:MAG: hypothetical protein ACK4I8_00900 [Armatimonadota bacterium]